MLDFSSWISGFIDGEGYFSVGERHSNGKHPSYRCAFGIELRDDDASILYEIRDYFGGIGSIYSRKRTRRYINEKPAVVWRVSKLDDVMVLIRHFDEYPLRAKKRKDYELWRQVAMELRKPSATRNLQLLGILKEKMHLCKQYDGSPLELPFPEPIPQMELFQEDG